MQGGGVTSMEVSKGWSQTITLVSVVAVFGARMPVGYTVIS